MSEKTKAKKKHMPERVKKGRVNYPLGDFLIRIKNASRAKNKNIDFFSTKVVKAVAISLKKQGILDSVEEKNGKITVGLAYKRKEPVLIDLKLISKPGLRVYMGVEELEKIKGPSIFLVSTPKGILSTKEVIKKRLGGEVIVEIW